MRHESPAEEMPLVRACTGQKITFRGPRILHAERDLGKMKNFNLNTTNNDEWLTPPELLKVLGPFDLDPCAPANRPWPIAVNHYTVQDDGLTQPWEGRVWLNPPYGRETFKWLARLADHGSGLALIFARTETQGFHEQVWGKADALFLQRPSTFLPC